MVAVWGDLGLRKMGVRREEMKRLFCKVLEGVEESKLVRMVVEKQVGSFLVIIKDRIQELVIVLIDILYIVINLCSLSL